MTGRRIILAEAPGPGETNHVSATAPFDEDRPGPRPAQPTTMELEPTQIKRGENDPNSATLEDRTRSLVAHEHSPTLMTGDQPGTGGQVRVWTPANWRYWAMPVLWAIGVLAWSLAGHVRENGLVLSVYCSNVLIWTYIAVRAMKRPRYLATDASGIAITTRSGSRAFRWEEIDALDGTLGSLNLKARGMPAPVQIDLTGFSGRDRRGLCDLISRRAHLFLSPGQQGRYTRIAAIEEPVDERRMGRPTQRAQ